MPKQDSQNRLKVRGGAKHRNQISRLQVPTVVRIRTLLIVVLRNGETLVKFWILLCLIEVTKLRSGGIYRPIQYHGVSTGNRHL